jgi:hypothetical protein
VSSIPGTNTLFEEQQINGHGQIKRELREERHRDKDPEKRETLKKDTEERQRRDHRTDNRRECRNIVQ